MIKVRVRVRIRIRVRLRPVTNSCPLVTTPELNTCPLGLGSGLGLG